MDPAPFSIRQLVWMATGRQQAEWERTAHLLALLINMNLPRGKSRVSPRDLNPFAKGRNTKNSRQLTAADCERFANSFKKNQGGGG
jgi:hypothetical protein